MLFIIYLSGTTFIVNLLRLSANLRTVKILAYSTAIYVLYLKSAVILGRSCKAIQAFNCCYINLMLHSFCNHFITICYIAFTLMLQA